MKFYPPGPITPYGSRILLDRTYAMVTVKSPDNGIHWTIHGGEAPYPGIQEGAYLVDGISGLHPPFTFVEHKGARQPGVTVQRTVFDAAEFDMLIEFTVPPDYDNPDVAALAIRRVINDWFATWDPANPCTFTWVTTDRGRWSCNARLFRTPPDRQFKAQARRLRQRYTWTIRNDDAFWRGVDSTSSFKFSYVLAKDNFSIDYAGNLGPQWQQTYSGAAQAVTPTGATLTLTGGTPVVTATHTGNQIVVPQGRVLTLTGSTPSLLGVSQVVRPLGATLTLTGKVPQVIKTAFTGACETDPKGFASWTPGGLAEAAVVNRLLGINEIQTITINGNFTGGTWTYTVNGQTATIPNGSTPTAVQAAIVALSNVGPNDITVSGPNGGPYVINFLGALGFQNITTDASGAGLTPGGTASAVNVGTQVEGTGPNTAGDAQVIEVAIGDAFQWPWPTGGSLDIWGRLDNNDAAPTGIRARIGQSLITLSRFNAGVETIMHQEILFISPAWWETWRLVCGSATNPRNFKVQRDNFTRMDFNEVGTGSVIGASNRGSGFGMKVGAVGAFTSFTQQVPPSIESFSVGDNVTVTQDGHLFLTNFGDQEGFPRYLVYGPGTFRIANGPDSTSMIEFGPLTDNQIALLPTIPRLRGVVDLSPDQPAQVLDGFQDFVQALVSLAVNKNVPPLLEQFESLFGIQPPQGPLYALLNGRFTNSIPAKPTGGPPPTATIPCQIVGGNADSKIIAALTPLRRWPE